MPTAGEGAGRQQGGLNLQNTKQFMETARKIQFGVIFYFILFADCVNGQWDEKYQEAYNYITIDTMNINNMLKEYMEFETFPQILISNERIYLSIFGFVRELFSVKNNNQTLTNHQLDSVLHKWDKDYRFEAYIDTTFPSTVHQCNINSLVIFFSSLNNNWLRVDLLPVTRKTDFNYNEISRHSNSWISYFFYYNEEKISNVFIKKGLK